MMFHAIYRRLRDVGVLSCPVYSISSVPAVHNLEEASKDAVQSKWATTHGQYPSAVLFGPLLGGTQTRGLIGLQVSNRCPDAAGWVRDNLPPSPWVVCGQEHTTYMFRSATSEFPSLQVLADGDNGPVVRTLQAGDCLPIESGFCVPTIESVENLPVLDGDEARSLLHDKMIPTLEKLLGIQFQIGSGNASNVTLGQIHIRLTRIISQICYEVLLYSKPLLPLVQELEALHQDLTRGFVCENLPLPYRWESYVQRLSASLAEDVSSGRYLLPPDWDKGMGSKLKARYGVMFSSDDKQMTFNQLKDYTFAKMCDAVGDESKMLAACQECMEQIALALTITKVERDTLKRFISKQSGMRLNMNQMESQMVELRKRNLSHASVPDIVDRALRLLARETEYRFDMDTLWAWNGSHWEATPTYLIEDKLYRFLNNPSLLSARTTVKNVILTILDRLRKPLARRAIKGVNFLNGFVTESLELMPHDPDLGLTYMLPFDYVPGQDSPPPKFANFLASVWGHEADFSDRVDALQEAMASTFFGTATTYQRAFLLYSVPLSGKSQLLDIVKGVMPTLKRTAVPPHNWGDRQNLKALQGKLLNVCGELSENRPINSQRFKDTVDGNEISAGESICKFGEELIRPQCAHWFASNHLPRTKDFSEGFTRRWQVFTFTKSISPEERVVNLGALIASQERSLIVSWALKANPRLVQQADYTQPASHVEVLNTIGNLNNTVRAFFTSQSVVAVQDLRHLKAMPREDLKELLADVLPLSGKAVHTLYCGYVQQLKLGVPVNEAEFYLRTKELANEMGFIQALSKDLTGTLLTEFYGVELLTGRSGTELASK